MLRSAQAGDPAALGLLLERFRAPLERKAQQQLARRLQSKVEPADVVQEVFLEVQRAFSRFRGQSERELMAWLGQILATRLALQHRQFMGTRKRNVGQEQPLATEQDSSCAARGAIPAGRDSSPSHRASRHEQAELLGRLLEQLSPDYREVMALRHVAGLPFAEVAARMNRSVDAVEKLWARALIQLRRLLPDDLA